MTNNENQKTKAKRVSNWFIRQTEKIRLTGKRLGEATEGIWVRFVILVFTALLSITGFDCINIDSCSGYFGWMNNFFSSHKYILAPSLVYDLTSSLQLGGMTLLSLPIALLLWFFRTYDVKKTLEKSEEGLRNSQKSYKQNDFFDAMKRLVSDNPLDIDLGVVRLIKLSENDELVKADIRLAFIKRLKYLPKEYQMEIEDSKLEKKTKLTYAQHILKWLYENKNNVGEVDLNNACFDFQEFRLDEYKQEQNPLTYFTENRYDKYSFRFADVREVESPNNKLRTHIYNKSVRIY